MNRLPPTRPLLSLAICALFVSALTASAAANTVTLRIVAYNIQADVSYGTAPLAGLICPFSGTGTYTTSCSGSTTDGGVLEGIGEEIVNGDPAQPVDVFALEETTSASATVQPILDGLNAFYSARTNSARYAMSPLVLTSTGGTGGGPSALVYNTNTIQLVESVGVGTPSGSGIARQVGRYLLAPAGVATNASNLFYIYVSHYKADSDTNSMMRRAVEAGVIRTNSASLPANSRILYVGDYNVSTSTETSYQDMVSNTLISYGVQGFDVFNPSGASGIDWTTSSLLSYKTETGRSLHYRYDFQLMSSNVYFGLANGLAYVPGTFHAFGNNGSVAYKNPIFTGNTSLNGNLMPNPPISAAQCYTNLYGASDHLPVVADYTITLPSAAPVANFSASPTNGPAPLAVNFTDIPSNSPTAWYWTFSDGGTSSTESPSHTFANPGLCSATLIASNSSGASSPVTQTIGVYDPYAWWQLSYFGSTNNAATTSPTGDFTGTGMSNTNKFLAGFDPTDPAAYLHILGIAATNATDMNVIYLGASGDNTWSPGIGSRTNILDFSTGDANGNYSNAGWQSTGQTNILGGGNGSGAVSHMVDPGGATNQPSRYYRIRVLVP